MTATLPSNVQVVFDRFITTGPHRLVGGFEVSPSRLATLRANAAKARRFRRAAKQELARRS